MLEKFGFNKSSYESTESKLSEFIRSRVLVIALGIATLASFEGCSKDYSNFGSFNEAFKHAREDKEQTFVWKDKKYNTKLVSKDFSQLYWESKKFLTDYYNSDYFKNKLKHVPDFSDSIDAEMIAWDKLQNNPRYQYLSKKFSRKYIEMSDKEEMSSKELDEYNKLLDDSERLNLLKSELYRSVLDSIAEARSEKNMEGIKKRINALDEPTYFSITDFKGKRGNDGSFDSNNNKVFLYGGSSKVKETVPIHELTHKSTKGDRGIEVEHLLKLQDRAKESIQKNGLVKIYIKREAENVGISSMPDTEFAALVLNWINYVTNPTEIDARQNSTRFWLHKHFKGYTAETVFTEEHFDFLNQNLSTLPYDIKQILELFPDKEDFIYNMNTF
jgi:hypothetical protein